MKTNRTIIAACIASLFVTGAAFAKDKWEYHEGDWSKTQSYRGVMVAQDSVGQWGPWEQFVEPAAGAPSIAFLGEPVGDPYRNIPDYIIPTPQDFCKAGQWCGYAIYMNKGDGEGQAEVRSLSYYKPPPGMQVPYGLFALSLTPDNPGAVVPGWGWGPGTVAWQLSPLNGSVAPTYGDSGGAMDAMFGTWFEGGLHRFLASRVGLDSAWATGDTHNLWWGAKLPTNNPEVAAGYFGRMTMEEFAAYVKCGERCYQTAGTEGYYVAGVVTPQSYLAGQVKATYDGWSLNYAGNKIPVHISVNFGNQTWNGSWNNGFDTSNRVGFNVTNGTINGATIQASSGNLSGYGGAVTGYVQGTFFGQTAGSIGGVSDVTKTYRNQTQGKDTAVFLVDKNGKPN